MPLVLMAVIDEAVKTSASAQSAEGAQARTARVEVLLPAISWGDLKQQQGAFA